MIKTATKSDLPVGSPVAGDVLDAKGALLLPAGTVVETEAFADLLVASGARIRLVEPSQPLAGRAPSAFETIDSLGAELAQACLNPQATTDFGKIVGSIADRLASTVETHPDAAIASIFLIPCDSYSVRHQVHAAILGELMADLLRLPVSERQSLSRAALTMNLAFLEYQDNLNTRTGGLSDDEKTTIFKHPLIGEQLLVTAGVTDPVWLSCVRSHHEKRDGSGYPEGLAGDTIPRGAQILQLVDVFSARISTRSWQERELANTTLADLLQRTGFGSGIAADLVKALIKALGAFPPGCFVKLANGEIALVVWRGQKATTPLVRSFCIGHFRHESPLLRDTSDPEFAIQGILPASLVDPPGSLRSFWS